jgi:L,D-transpeptidase YbiS
MSIRDVSSLSDSSVDLAVNNPSPSDIDIKVYEIFKKTCEMLSVSIGQTLLLINADANAQTLHLYKEGKWACSYPISTAKNGMGEVKGSGKTPSGLHKICEKIGTGADLFAIFEARQITGEIAIKDQGKECITTRILRLAGEENIHNSGKNNEGQCVDSFDRHIYIHGTNYVTSIGKQGSKGCVRMNPSEMIKLFDEVTEGTLVFIYSDEVFKA